MNTSLLNYFKIETHNKTNYLLKNNIENDMSNNYLTKNILEKLDYLKSIVAISLLPDFNQEFNQHKNNNEYDLISIKLDDKFYNWDYNYQGFLFDMNPKKEEIYKNMFFNYLKEIKLLNTKDLVLNIYYDIKQKTFSKFKNNSNNKEINILNLSKFDNIDFDYIKRIIKDSTPIEQYTNKEIFNILENLSVNYNILIKLRLQSEKIFKFISETYNIPSDYYDNFCTIFFEKIKKIIKIHKNILLRNFYVAIGKYNSNVKNKKSFPFSLNCILDFTNFYDNNKIYMIPKDILKISKPNIFISEKNDDETLLNEYDTETEQAIDLTLLENIFTKKQLGKEHVFIGDTIILNKWNELIDEIQKSFLFSEKYQLNPILIFFEPKKELKALYDAYELAIETIQNFSPNQKINIFNENLLFKSLNNFKSSKETEDIQLKELLTQKEPIISGLLKENINSNGEYYSLNNNQKIFNNKALNFLDDEESYIIALNGPPGTGKTTVLQSFIATKTVKSLINNKEELPEIIFGCSATNQAKNNIILGFKHSEIHNHSDKPICTRWIQIPTGKNTINEDDEFNIPENLELDYGVSLAQDASFNFFKFVSYMWNNHIILEKMIIDNYNNFIDSELLNHKQIKKLEILNSFFNLKNGTFPSLLNSKNLDDIVSNLLKLLNFNYSKTVYIEEQKNNMILELKNLNNKQKTYEYLNNLINHDNNIRLKSLSNITDNDYLINELDDILSSYIDNSLKTINFHISMRINEARFVKELKEMTEKNIISTSKENIKKKFKVFSLISPIFVSTMHSLSNRIKYFTGIEQSNISFIDILIIDEAGQISPEVGGLSFLLSKKALVLGDIYQIKPVYNVDNKTDYAIYKAKELNPQYNEVNFSSYIWNCHSSSIMKIAQSLTPWHQKPNLERGLYLTEHNRCPIEIISFCDEIIYKNELKYSVSSFYLSSNGTPKYNNSLLDICFKKTSYNFNKNQVLDLNKLFLSNQTPWKLITNTGECLGKNIRINREEISSILKWIDDNYLSLINKGEKKLNNIIAIITPFKKQAYEINKIALNYNFKNISEEVKEALFDLTLKNKTDNLIIGTVHSLQGAEIPIVLFSNVYGYNDRHIQSTFIDRESSIINVAVSRAKQSFYLFANEEFLKHYSNKNKLSTTSKLYNYIREFK